MHTLAWAMMDNFGLSVEKNRQFQVASMKERNAVCAPMEGRLRSRCGGLLEITKIKVDAGYPSESMINEHDIGFDYTVGFIHRTVCEFLNKPETWKRECLHIEEPAFDAFAVITLMSLPTALILIQKRPTIPRWLPIMREAMEFASFSDLVLKYQNPLNLSRVERTLEVLLQSTEPHDGSHTRISPLILTVEMSVKNWALYLYKTTADTNSGFPLLCHAIPRPYFRKFFGEGRKLDVRHD